VQLKDRHYSEATTKQAVWLSGLVDFAQAAEILQQVGQVAMSSSSVWRGKQRRGWTWARDTQVLGDGSAWSWKLTGTYFYERVQTVDWYHAMEHLAQAARLLEGEGTPAAGKWFKDRETQLYEGPAYALAQALTQAAKRKRKVAQELRKEVGYLQTNQGRMQYMELREEGYLIGSGTEESA